MFGYINVLKDELKVKEYNDFKSYYCGLCKCLGKRFNQLVRFGLNYDLTFLACLLDSIYDDETEFDNVGCIKSVSKKKTVINNRYIDFASDMSVILTYYKLKDDVKDDKSIKAFFASIPYFFSVKKLKGKYDVLTEKIKSNLCCLSKLEKEKCVDIDKVAHPFAMIMSDIFREANPALANLGYNLGRYIFFVDALDDMDKDLKDNNYNVYNLKYNYDGNLTDEQKNHIKNSILTTLSYVSEEYEKLPKFKNKQILDNIVYLGIRHKFEYLILKTGCQSKKGK